MRQDADTDAATDQQSLFAAGGAAEAEAAELAALGVSSAGGQPRYLLFTMAELGLCALPVEAVQTVSLPDGPCRRVPGRGGRQSRFCGLVSVRGQVQLCFDMSAGRLQCGSLCGASAQGVCGCGTPLLVAGWEGSSLALKVAAPLQLVERLEVFTEPLMPLPGELGSLVDGCFCVPEVSGNPQTVWVLSTGRLFDFLAKEAARNG